MTTASFHGGRTIGALGLSFRAINCAISVPTSLGACSASSRSQSNPARPSTSVVIGFASEHQQPISRLWARRSWRKRLGMPAYGVVGFMGRSVSGLAGSFLERLLALLAQ